MNATAVQNRPTLAFVDHSFHKFSRSGDFLRTLFSDRFEIVDYWDDAWQGGQSVPVNEINKHEYVFFFQSIASLRDLRQIRAKMVWAPMYDSEKFDHLYWKVLANLPIKIISFSKKIHEQCVRYGVDFLPVQYYKNSRDWTLPVPQEGNHFFFWYRGDIGFEDIKRIVRSDDVDSFIYKSTPDPKRKRESISAEDKVLYKMEIIEADFIPIQEYRNLLSRSNIFIASRRKEGIGMSFVEALAAGHCVVGYNDATMNEYIEDDTNGYLFDEKSPMLDFSNSNEVRTRSIGRAHKGYEMWKKDAERIASFMLSTRPPAHHSVRTMFYILGYTCMTIARKVIRKARI